MGGKHDKIRSLYSVNNTLIFIDFKVILTFIDQDAGLLHWDFKEDCTYKLVKCMSHCKVVFDPRFSYQPSITLGICPKCCGLPSLKHHIPGI